MCDIENQKNKAEQSYYKESEKLRLEKYYQRKEHNHGEKYCHKQMDKSFMLHKLNFNEQILFYLH